MCCDVRLARADEVALLCRCNRLLRAPERRRGTRLHFDEYEPSPFPKSRRTGREADEIELTDGHPHVPLEDAVSFPLEICRRERLTRGTETGAGVRHIESVLVSSPRFAGLVS